MNLGAPECCRDLREFNYHQIYVGPEADVWSLGCVLSEVLVWTILRECGRSDYAQQRSAAIERIEHMHNSGYGGSFHTVESRLDVVKAFHEMAVRLAPKDDFITECVSDMILSDMLEVSKDSRLTPDKLYHRFTTKIRSRPPPPTTIGSRVRSPAEAAPVTAIQLPPSVQDAHPSTRSPLDAERSRNPENLRPGRCIAKSPTVRLPHVTFRDVLQWQKKYGGKKRKCWWMLRRGSREAKLDGSEYLNQLTDRDHVSPPY